MKKPVTVGKDPPATVALPSRAVTELQTAGLVLAKARSGARMKVVVRAGSRLRSVLLLIPMGDGSWSASVPAASHRDWSGHPWTTFHDQLVVMLSVAALQPSKARMTLVVERLRDISRRMESAHGRKPDRVITGSMAPEERLDDPLHPWQGGAPGLVQQRK